MEQTCRGVPSWLLRCTGLRLVDAGGSHLLDGSPARTRRPSWAQRVWSRIRPHRWTALGGVLASGLLLMAVGPRLMGGPAVAVATVVQRDFVQSVVASGHVEAPHRVSIGAQIVGTVRRVPVAEGDTVRTGQVLVELESAEARAAAAQADAAVRQAQARLRQLREVQEPVAQSTLRQAVVTQDNARAQWRRSLDLFQKGFIGQAALDDARKAFDMAQAQVRSAASQLQAAQPSGSDVAVAASALAQARASADAAHARLGYAVIASPAAGTLIARNVETGDVVQPGKALMVLSPAGAIELVVQIDEKNLHLLDIGQPALASADAYPDQRFEATVNHISPGIDAQRGSVEVKLAVSQPPAYLRQDMTVSVDIQTARRPNALLLPVDAVHDIDGGAPWVLSVEGGRARRRAVTVGLRGGGLVEVREGLRAGAQVVAATATEIRDGSRLRVQAPRAAR